MRSGCTTRLAPDSCWLTFSTNTKMKLSKLPIFLLVALSVQAYASDASLQELSIRSGLSRDQLQEFVSACDSNQLSMYFCAWNSEIASEQELHQVVTDKLRDRPKCQSAVTALSK